VPRLASLRLQGDRERYEIEIEMREKERRRKVGVDRMGGREKEDKEINRKGASGLEGGARRFSRGWCLHLGLKGPLSCRVEKPPGTKSFVPAGVST
jgi:hypothetical protein